MHSFHVSSFVHMVRRRHVRRMVHWWHAICLVMLHVWVIHEGRMMRWEVRRSHFFIIFEMVWRRWEVLWLLMVFKPSLLQEPRQWVLCLLCAISFSIFIDCCYDCSRCIIGRKKLDEGVVMTCTFFTQLTEVEVLTNATLVSNTNDWADTAPIASHVLVFHKLCAFDLF